jgi:transcriptional regulator with XRE-family HTH domain
VAAETGIGERIKNIMRKKGVTQIQLAAMIGMSEGHMSRILQGRTVPMMDKIERIAEALDIPMAALWDEDKAITVLASDVMASLPKEFLDALGDVRGREWLLLGLSMRDKELTKEEIELILTTYSQAKRALEQEKK